VEGSHTDVEGRALDNFQLAGHAAYRTRGRCGFGTHHDEGLFKWQTDEDKKSTWQEGTITRSRIDGVVVFLLLVLVLELELAVGFSLQAAKDTREVEARAKR
jgi:hypothetical protein